MLTDMTKKINIIHIHIYPAYPITRAIPSCPVCSRERTKSGMKRQTRKANAMTLPADVPNLKAFQVFINTYACRAA